MSAMTTILANILMIYTNQRQLQFQYSNEVAYPPTLSSSNWRGHCGTSYWMPPYCQWTKSSGDKRQRNTTIWTAITLATSGVHTRALLAKWPTITYTVSRIERASEFILCRLFGYRSQRSVACLNAAWVLARNGRQKWISGLSLFACTEKKMSIRLFCLDSIGRCVL